jgi:hypothetical protein
MREMRLNNKQRLSLTRVDGTHVDNDMGAENEPWDGIRDGRMT